eukprot:GHVH01008508.1.p2 GENE.GHVH01008508.1~~GHVH01008508.1.p2  ORF type:complete len:281 (-),score=60.20 GHVH01008508.1:99-941(-)
MVYGALFEEKVRFHNEPLYYSVTEADTKPRSAKHEARMTEADKKAMARNAKLYKEKVAALDKKAKDDVKIAMEVSDRAIVSEKARVAQFEKNAADKVKAAASGKLFQEPESSLLLVVRIKGVNQMPPKPKKALSLLRLRQINSAVFVKVNKATMAMLTICRPWITYGPPTVELIRSLVYKRGYVRTGCMGHRDNVRIQSNDIVAQVLEKSTGIVGVEDLINEISDVRPNFTTANRALAPFRLNNPAGGFKNKKNRQFTEMHGGEAGDRGHYINDLVFRMC